MNNLTKLKIKDFAGLKYGKMPKKEDLRESGYPVFSGYKITGFHKEYIYEDPTLIVVARGVGGTGDVKISPPKCYLTNLAIAFHLDSSKVDRDYLYYYFLTKDLRSLDTGSAQSQITTGVLSEYEVEIHELPIQRKIASILRKFDDLIEINEKKIKCLEEMARRIYREWFVDFRFPGYENGNMVDSGHPDFGMIPEGWKVQGLGEIAAIDWGDTSKTKSIYTETGYVAYSASGPDGKIPYFDFDRDGIVLSAIGANCGATWFATGKWSCIKNTIKYWATGRDVPESFLFYATHGNDFFPKRGSAQPFISKGDCEARPILVPAKSILTLFNEIVHPTLILQENLKVQNTLLSNERDLLLPKLISGEIDVSELEFEEASSITTRLSESTDLTQAQGGSQ